MLAKYLALPAKVTPFEQRYLKRLNKIALIFFYLHIPAFMAVAWVAGTNPLTAFLLSAFVMVGPTLAYRQVKNPRALSVIYGVTAMLMGGLLVHFGQGPVQIEMHFYFFALLAMLCMFANPMVNIAAALTVALHHLLVWILSPASVFNYEAQWWVVLVHAAFVVLETIAACYISREFFDNVIGLEKIIEDRTETIREKQRDMRLILDNVETGLITIDLAGRMSSEYSQVIARWFGAPIAGERLSDWLGQRDPAFGDWFELGCESVADGLLPVDVALDQLPRQLRVQDKTYALHYQAIMQAQPAAGQEAEAGSQDGPPEKILVILSDISERLRSEEYGRQQAELLQLFQHITRDKAGFMEFLRETEDLLMALRQSSSLELSKRLIHTIKGNAALFGLGRLAALCHGLEDRIAEEGLVPTPEALEVLYQAWSQQRAEVAELLGEQRETALAVGPTDYQAVYQALSDGLGTPVVARMMESWQLEPMAQRLSRIEAQIKSMAQRLDKQNFSVSLAHHELRCDAERFAPFWSAFVHVLRNTVDHAIEPPEQRAAGGKPADCRIAISTNLAEGHFVVSIEDDCPGIDWDTLKARASELGLAAGDQEVIFLPGVSSSQTVSEHSGRGIGMGAVRSACEALEGKIEIASSPGRGTRLSFSFPQNQAVYEGHAALLGLASRVPA